MTILGQPFTVEYVEAGLFDNDTLGKTMAIAQRLIVKDGMGPHQERDTLLHEVLHACGLAVGHEFEEHQVAAFAPVLLDVLRQNPALVEYLTESV